MNATMFLQVNALKFQQQAIDAWLTHPSTSLWNSSQSYTQLLKSGEICSLPFQQIFMFIGLNCFFHQLPYRFRQLQQLHRHNNEVDSACDGLPSV